jgi:hypothetical protein
MDEVEDTKIWKVVVKHGKQNSSGLAIETPLI